MKENKMTDSEDTNSSRNYLTIFVAEVIGTGMLMFFGCLGCLIEDSPVAQFIKAIAFGLTVMLVIQTVGHISGAHLNSCVTIASFLMGQIRATMAAVYITAEFVGAILGFGLLKMLINDVENGFCVTNLKSTVSVWQGFVLETVISTVLVLVCCGLWDARNAHKDDSIPLRFGFIISVISITVGPYTGASMNTQRSFAPLIWGGSWENQWIYWVAPNLSSFIAVGLYRCFFASYYSSSRSQSSDDMNTGEVAKIV